MKCKNKDFNLSSSENSHYKIQSKKRQLYDLIACDFPFGSLIETIYAVDSQYKADCHNKRKVIYLGSVFVLLSYFVLLSHHL